jgi:cytochrome b6-f complex iron-sulfur subunit
MAERPSIQEILARVRAGGPAKPESEPEATAAPDVEAASEPAPAPKPAPPPRASGSASAAPAPPGRPLTLKEKLAAARGRPGGGEAAERSEPPASEVVETVAEAPVAEAPVAAPSAAATHLTPEALGRPLTLKEKLAAARGAGPSAAPATTAPAKPKAAPAASGTPAAKSASARAIPPLEKATDPRDLAEHLRRAGAEQEKKTKADVAAKAPASKAAPKKAESKVVPPRPGREVAAVPTRRQLFKVGVWIAAGWAAFTAGMATLLAGSARFFFPNVLAEPPSTIKVGSPGDFEKGQVEERWKAEWGFWIVRSDAYDGEDKIYALSSICTHLGCPPNWLASEQKFKCPCHGSGFYISGVNFEGPAPRPLERYKLTIGDDGQLVVDKSQKFQEELGQWKDPESYLKV